MAVNPAIEPNRDAAIAFLHDPLIATRRRLHAIMAGIVEQLEQHRNNDPSSSRLADWFFTFRTAALRNENISAVFNEHIPQLQRLLEEEQFRSHAFVRIVLNAFIPRLQTLFSDRQFPQVPPNYPQLSQREERLRQIQARTLDMAIQREQRREENRQQLQRLVNVPFQEELQRARVAIQAVFDRNVAALEQRSQRDRELTAQAQNAIDRLGERLSVIEAVLLQLGNRVELNNAALERLETALVHAHQETARLEEAMRAKNEGGSSIFGAIIGAVFYIALRVALSNAPLPLNIEIIPTSGGGMAYLPIPIIQ